MSVFKNLYVRKDLKVEGNLEVSGTQTITNISSENLLIGDRFMVSNAKLTSGSATGGLAINYDVSASVPLSNIASSGVITCGDLTASLGVGDFIMVSGTEQNDGVYEILSIGATSITINPSPDAGYVSGSSLVDEAVAGTVAGVSLSIIQSSITGAIETSFGKSGSDLNTNVKEVSLSGAASSNTSITLTDTANQITLGTTNTTTINSTASDGAQTVEIPELSSTSDTFVFLAEAQTLTNKTLSAPTINSATLSLDDANSLFDLSLVCASTTMLASRSLIFDVKDADKTLTLDGNLTISGTHSLTLTQTGVTDVTLPVSGVLATLDGGETLTNKIIVKSVTAHTDADATISETGTPIHTFAPSVVRTATLPSVSTSAGLTFKFIMLSGAGSVQINESGIDTNTIEGETNLILDTPLQHTSLTCDGSNWYVNL